MRARSISCEMLMETGAKVAQALKAEKGIGVAETEIAYFVDYGIFGGKKKLEAVADMDIRQIAELSARISSEVIAPVIAVTPAVSIKDGILIFGGELDPSVAIGR